MATVLFLTTDLMFSSRVLGAAKAMGLNCRLIAQPAQISQMDDSDCRLALIDLTLQPLDLPAVVAAIRGHSPEARTVAFGPHVDEELLSSARSAGCDLVWARSQFHKQYVDLLRDAAGG